MAGLIKSMVGGEIRREMKLRVDDLLKANDKTVQAINKLSKMVEANTEEMKKHPGPAGGIYVLDTSQAVELARAEQVKTDKVGEQLHYVAKYLSELG